MSENSGVRCPNCGAEDMSASEQQAGICYDCQAHAGRHYAELRRQLAQRDAKVASLEPLVGICAKLANIAEVVGHCSGTWTPEHAALAREYAGQAREALAKAAEKHDA